MKSQGLFLSIPLIILNQICEKCIKLICLESEKRILVNIFKFEEVGQYRQVEKGEVLQIWTELLNCSQSHNRRE